MEVAVWIQSIPFGGVVKQVVIHVPQWLKPVIESVNVWLSEFLQLVFLP